MKKNLLFSTISLLAVSIVTTVASPKDDVKAAAAALGNAANYSWTNAVPAGGGGGGGGGRGFRGGPSGGKTEKDGYTTFALSFGGNETDVILKGTNAVIKTQDADWQSLADATKDNGDGGGGFNPMMFMAGMIRGFQTPAVQAAALVDDVKDLTDTGTNGISGDLTEDGAKKLLSFRPRGGGGGGGMPAPEITGAKGSVTFWIADGKLVKYQTHVSGTVSFNGNDRDMDRTTTMEITDIGTTKIEVPDAAKKKLE